MSQTKIFVMGLVLGIIFFAIAFYCSSCALVEGITDIIISPKDKTVSVPDTSKGQLWKTIQGLTPNWLAIPIIALGAVAVFNGAAKLGFSFVIFGSVNLFMALATSRFGFWMAVFGLIGSVAAVAASVLTKNKALRDIILGVQKVKVIAKEDNVDLVFQDKMKKILTEQVKSTRTVVAKIKTKLRAAGKITVS